MSPQQNVMVIGDIEIARRACAALGRQDVRVRHLPRPDEQQLQASLTADLHAVAILVRDDVAALRYALLVEHLRPGIRMVVLLFDRTIADQLLKVMPCQVTSPADISVPAIIGACLGGDILAVDTSRTPAEVITATATRPWRPESRVRAALRALRRQIRSHDLTSRLLLTGLGGLAGTLLLEWLLAMLVLHQRPAAAFYGATRVIATVGPGEGEHAPSWYLVVSGTGMLLTLGFTALFTAGIVNRFLSVRSIDIVGPRTLPRRDHIVVVGLGQVSLRLCKALRRLGLPVVAIERDPQATNLRLAKAAGIPVLIAHAQDREVLRRVNLHRARAFAAMGADGLDNVEAAIAALALAPELRIVLRAGDSTVISETRSLFPIGDVCDIAAMTVQAVLHSMNGRSPRFVYPRDGVIVAHPPPPPGSTPPADNPQDHGRRPRPSATRCTCPDPRDRSPERIRRR